jgi:hypothetical protein
MVPATPNPSANAEPAIASPDDQLERAVERKGDEAKCGHFRHICWLTGQSIV